MASMAIATQLRTVMTGLTVGRGACHLLRRRANCKLFAQAEKENNLKEIFEEELVT